MMVFDSSVTGESFVDETRVCRTYKVSILVSTWCVYSEEQIFVKVYDDDEHQMMRNDHLKTNKTEMSPIF